MQDKSRRVGSDNTLSFALQYQDPNYFLSECTGGVYFIYPHNIMLDKQLFYGSSQYNSCTYVISYFIKENEGTFTVITRFKS